MENIQMIPVTKIWPHPDNPRKDLGDLTELAASIKENGILQNLTVVKKYGEITGKWDEENPTYTVIIGHRRLEAAKLAGLETVPCVVADMTDTEQFRTMVIENMQRSDLTIVEQADSFQMMLDLGETKEEIAEKTGFSKTTIDRRLKLKKLDRQKLIEADNRGGTLFDYMELYKVDDPEVRNELLESIGTSNFKNNLQIELNKQEKAKIKAKIIPLIEEFAKKMPKSEESKRWGSEYDQVQRYTYSKDEEIKAPEDTSRTYYYYDSSYDITIYAKAQKQKKDKKPEIVAQYEEWYKAKTKELDETCARHKELRTEFWKGLSEYTLRKREYRDTLIEFFVKACSGYFAGLAMSSLYHTTDFIQKAYEIEKAPYSCSADEKREIISNIINEPMKLMLTEIISMFEDTSTTSKDYSTQYIRYKYSNKYTLYKIIPNSGWFKDKHEALVDFLESIGYDVPEEERAIIDGTYFEHINDDAPILPGIEEKENEDE